jgi:hypothetical protein
MDKILLFFWSIGEVGILLSRFTDLYIDYNEGKKKEGMPNKAN